MKDNTISGAARVGGIFGDIGGANHVPKMGSVVGGSVTGTTLVGGVAGNVFNTTMYGYLSNTTVSASGTGAGCLVGQGSGGFNVRMENAVGVCPSVTAGGSSSYFIPIGLNASPGTNNVYFNPGGDEVLGAGYVHLSFDQLVNPSITSTHLAPGDPWILNPGEIPVPYWFVFPEALEHD